MPGQVAGARVPLGFSLHPQARQLAQHRGKRIELPDSTEPEKSAPRRYRPDPRGNSGLASGKQQEVPQRRSAI